MRQHKFSEAEVIRKDTARILEIDHYPNDDATVVRFGIGGLDDRNVFILREEKSVRLSKEETPPAMRAALDTLTDGLFDLLVERGSLPSGAAEAAPAVLPPPAPPSETPEAEGAAEPAPVPRTARTPRRTP